jgi:predicted ribosome quality control (RQC) complex YloA/Tae2 family protein
MNLEGITLKVLTKELKEALEGGKIFRVFMPAKNSLLLLINKDNQTINFLADFSGASPLVYLPDSLPERPNIPPVFCMLLRKHLEEGRITCIAQKGLDRIITFSIDMLGAGQQIITKHLIFELTGKDSNVIFTDENNIIQDSMRHIGKAQSSFRQILPGLTYTAPPEQTGLDFISTASGAIISAAENTADQPILTRLISSTLGIGKNTAQEILTRSDISPEALKLNPQESLNCQKSIQAIQEEIKNCLDTDSYNVYGLINQRQVIKILVPYKPAAVNNETLKVFPVCWTP